jgi:RimJ/RimL family protein N-acetyltransferase
MVSRMPEPITLPEPPLSDGAIALRAFRPEDVPAIVAACQDPEIQRWIPLIPVPYGEDEARGYVLMTLKSLQEGSSAEVAIVDARSDELVGAMGVHLGSNPRRHSIGYWVAPHARGKGVATAALRLLSRWSFERFGTERLALWTLVGNEASQAVARKAGFRYEGVARNWDVGRDGRPLDCVMYALTPQDLAGGREGVED